jgi:hypothetical protein
VRFLAGHAGGGRRPSARPARCAARARRRDRLPFCDGRFDAVGSTEAFRWSPDQDAALRAQVEAAGFRVEEQRRVWRLPGFLLPPALTVARRT